MSRNIDLCTVIGSDDEVDCFCGHEEHEEPINDVVSDIDTTRPWIVDEMDSIRAQMKEGDTDVLVMNDLYIYEKLSTPVTLKIGDRTVQGIILFSFNGTVELEVKDENIRGICEVPHEFLKIASEICASSESTSQSDDGDDSYVRELDRDE